MNEELAEVFRYDRWANLTLIEACRPPSDEHLDTLVPGTSVTIRELRIRSVLPGPCGRARRGAPDGDRAGAGARDVRTPDLDGWAYGAAAGYGREVTREP